MDLHAWGIASGYLGSAFGVAMVLPQILRTFRNRAIAGVSATSWSLTALACLGWLLYGVRAGEAPQIPGNVLLVAGAVVIVLAVPARPTSGQRAALLAAGAATMVCLAAVLPADSLGYVAFGFGLVSSWPQTVESVARARSGGQSAVSVSAWVLRAASQLCWLIYALVLHDLPVTIAASVTLTSALALVVAETRHQALSRAAVSAAVAT